MFSVDFPVLFQFQATVHHSNGEGDARDEKNGDHTVDMRCGPDLDEAVAQTKQVATKKAKSYISTSFLALDKVLPRRYHLCIHCVCVINDTKTHRRTSVRILRYCALCAASHEGTSSRSFECPDNETIHWSFASTLNGLQ